MQHASPPRFPAGLCTFPVPFPGAVLRVPAGTVLHVSPPLPSGVLSDALRQGCRLSCFAVPNGL